MFYEEGKKQFDEEDWRKIFKKDLEPSIIQFSKRGLTHTAKW